MKLSEIKLLLPALDSVNFKLPNGTYVPESFHITEIGHITKNFIDCGGTLRKEEVVSFQLWNAHDHDHRLKPSKLLKIISLSESVLNLPDGEIEVEYQSDTIGKYDLGFDGTDFLLLPKQTACLASDQCGMPKEKTSLASLSTQNSCCNAEGNCC